MSLFRELWLHAPIPDRLRTVRTMAWEQFASLVWAAPEEFVHHFVRSVAAGDAWLLRGAFSAEFMRGLKDATVRWTSTREESFHKMLDGAPDFHRRITPELGKQYAIEACKHSAYFYRWNDDPLGIWPAITERWSVAKLAMGLRADEYERNTASDGVVDRIQVVRYPPAAGFLEPHRDAHQHQRLFFSGYMSKRGRDYAGGGFYFVDRQDVPLFLEDAIEVGDVCLGHANLLHGVAPCDRHLTPDWGATDGRWFLSMYSNASDVGPARHTARPVKVDVEGVLP